MSPAIGTLVRAAIAPAAVSMVACAAAVATSANPRDKLGTTGNGQLFLPVFLSLGSPLLVAGAAIGPRDAMSFKLAGIGAGVAFGAIVGTAIGFGIHDALHGARAVSRT